MVLQPVGSAEVEHRAGRDLSTDQWENVPAIPDQNGHNNYWGTVQNPSDPANGWVHAELVIEMTTDTTGFFQYFEDGVKVMDYAGPTTFASTRTVESIGGYARNQGPAGRVMPFTSTGAAGDYTQWRYYANLYNDRETSGLGRFVLVTDGMATEIQPYVTYSADSVDLIINKGNLPSGPAQIHSFIDEAFRHCPLHGRRNRDIDVTTECPVTTAGMPIARNRVRGGGAKTGEMSSAELAARLDVNSSL